MARPRLRALLAVLALASGGLARAATPPPALPPGEGLLRALYVDQQGLGPRGVRGSVRCDDTRAREANTIEAPWCSLTNGAFAKVLPGDIVYVRAGTYKDMATGAQASFPKFAVALTRRGSPTHHIWYSAYPGESVSIEPAVPGGGPANCTFNAGGRNDLTGCQWVGLGLAPIGWLGPEDGTCYTAPVTWKKGGACGSDADCGGTVGSCHRNGVDCTGGVDAPLFGACKYYVTINGFRFQHWNHWDKRLNASTRWPSATGGPWGDEVPARLSYYAVELNRAQGTPSQITIQHCEFTDNTNVIFTHNADGITIQYNQIRDNHTHGFTSPVNLYEPRGALNGPNVVRGNVITNSQDDAPPWCLTKICTDPGVDGPGPLGRGNTCTDSVDGYGLGCTCVADANCQSGRCAEHAPGVPNACDGNQPNNDAQTEGNAVIFDMPQGLCTPASGIAGYCTYPSDPRCGTNACQMGRGGALLMEGNVAYENYGACFNGTRSANVVFRNNTCYHNGKKKRPDTDAEVTTFGSIALHNNILVPTAQGTCKCARDADCGGPHGHCQSTGGIGAFCRTGTRSRCTQDGDCPDVAAMSGAPGGKLCLPVQALELVTGADDKPNRWPYTFYAGDTEIGANLLYGTIPAASRALISVAPGALSQLYTVAGFKAATTIKQCVGGSRARESCMQDADCTGGGTCTGGEVNGGSANWPVVHGWAGNGGSMPQRLADPLFTNPPANLALQAGSPAIDAGDPAHRAPLDQQRRTWVTVDIGALAFGAAGSPTTPPR